MGTSEPVGTSGQAAVPRDAATVVLLKDSAAGPEVYLQRRAATMAFAAGVHVFPGGAMDLGDADLVRTAVREVEEETGIRLAPSGLHPWSRWVTPAAEPRRYDTRFYVARLPDGAEPTGVGTEMDMVAWWTPSAALAARDRDELILWEPTLVTLAEVGAWITVAEVLAASRDRDLEPR